MDGMCHVLFTILYIFPIYRIDVVYTTMCATDEVFHVQCQGLFKCAIKLQYCTFSVHIVDVMNILYAKILPTRICTVP